ncbi:MAG: hypothetical protein IT350_04555 [Deltaproteobacteria bacterium]|nr:hypothetical protein [Deltaproteobacteria bacterium]
MGEKTTRHAVILNTRHAVILNTRHAVILNTRHAVILNTRRAVILNEVKDLVPPMRSRRRFDVRAASDSARALRVARLQLPEGCD